MQLGDLVKYRWWIDEKGIEYGADEPNKKTEIGVILNPRLLKRKGTVYAEVQFVRNEPPAAVPGFKLEVLNESR
jgi:hypothetical protein